MNEVFRTCPRKFVLVFFDDILIYNECLEDQVAHVAMVFGINEAE